MKNHSGCSVEIFESKKLAGEPSRWVVYVEKAGKESKVVYSRRTRSMTTVFPTLQQARTFVECHGLAMDDQNRLVRIFQMPAPG